MYSDLISRRAALRVLGLGAAAGLLAACGTQSTRGVRAYLGAGARTDGGFGGRTNVCAGGRDGECLQAHSATGRLRVTAEAGRYAEGRPDR